MGRHPGKSISLVNQEAVAGTIIVVVISTARTAGDVALTRIVR